MYVSHLMTDKPTVVAVPRPIGPRTQGHAFLYKLPGYWTAPLGLGSLPKHALEKIAPLKKKKTKKKSQQHSTFPAECIRTNLACPHARGEHKRRVGAKTVLFPHEVVKLDDLWQRKLQYLQSYGAFQVMLNTRLLLTTLWLIFSSLGLLGKSACSFPGRKERNNN